jgi:hypothetical protein
MTRKVSLGVVAGVACAVLAACSGEEAAPIHDIAPADTSESGTFVGTVARTDAYIALVTDGTSIGGYVSDGKRTALYLDASKLDDGTATLVSWHRHASVGSVAVVDDVAIGKVRLNGTEHAFTAEAATGKAGFRRVVKRNGDSVVSDKAWVVLADGSYRGAKTKSGTVSVVGRPKGPSWDEPDIDP